MNSVFAGIVLFNPDLGLLQKNIQALIQQVPEIVCIDNASNNIKEIEAFLNKIGKVNLIKNTKNEGIAVALNQLLAWGSERNYSWVLFMDQDSVAELDIIKQYQSYMGNEKIAILCPKIIDMNSDVNSSSVMDVSKETILRSDEVITSGSCVNVQKALEIDGFDERLFIDFVDTDFNERCLRNGYQIIRINTTKLSHQIGKIRVISILGWKVICTNHSAFRRYYMVRNRLYFRRKYFGRWACLKERIRLLLGDAKILLFEDEKRAKIFASIKGFRDYHKLL